MNTDRIQIDEDEDEIDIKEVFKTIYQYRNMIISLVILFATVSSYYAYFKPNVYKASATVEVGMGQFNYGNQDILNMAMDPGALNVDTEMEIIKSRFLSEQALKKVDFAHHYYTTRKFKEIELYKDSPFQVGLLKGYGISFDLIPVDENSYRLIVEESIDNNGIMMLGHDEIHSYGKEIITEYFHLNVIKIKEAQDAQYRFVIQDPEKIRSFVPGGVNVSQTSKYSTILQISYFDNVPLRAKEFTNALAEAYIQQNIEKKTKEATRKLTFIDKQLKLITENLKGSAIKLEEFKKSSNTVNLSSKAENIIRQMSEHETKLAEISIQEEMLGTLYKQVKSGKNLESLSVAGVEMGQSSLSDMTKKLQDAIVKKKVLREDYTEMYPGVRKLSKTITQLQELIVSTITSLNKSIKERKVLLEKSIAQLQKHLNTLPADERMYGQLQRKFAVNEKIYSYLLEKRSETAIIKASTVSKNRIIDKALTPQGTIKPKRKLIVFVGMILGLILGIALAFLREFMDDRIKNEEDVFKVLSIPLIGTIPHIKENHEIVNVFKSPKSAVSESFRNLRTNLQFMTKSEDAHLIAVTSTVGGEGKTTVCINLAGIMSMSGKRTILINLDMRKPTLHIKFELPNNKGMSSILSHRARLSEVINHTKYENLDVITSGPIPPNPSELIQSKEMELILEELNEMYDVIIFDTPPVGLVTDARILMHLADTSIYVIRAGYSRKEFLRNIEKLSHSEEIHDMGILLNDVYMNKSAYGYGYYEDNKK